MPIQLGERPAGSVAADLILLDSSLPGLSGEASAKLIRKPSDDPMPTVLYSSRPCDDLVAMGRQLNVEGVVHESESASRLVIIVSSALSRTASQAGRARKPVS